MQYIQTKLSQLVQFVLVYGFVGIFRFLNYNIKQVVGTRGDLYSVVLPNGSTAKIRRRTTDLSTFFQVWIQQHYDLTSMPFWKDLEDRYNEILNQGRIPLVIDGGANIGLSMLYFNELFPKANVVGIEADASNFALAKLNTASFEALEIRNLALFDTPCELSVIENDPHHKDAVQVSSKNVEGAQIVEATTVDLVATSGSKLHDLLLVKLDIEGGEAAALYGAQQAQIDGVPFIIEPHDWLPNVRGSICGLETMFKNWNFDFFVRSENVYVIPFERKT